MLSWRDSIILVDEEDTAAAAAAASASASASAASTSASVPLVESGSGSSSMCGEALEAEVGLVDLLILGEERGGVVPGSSVTTG